MSQQGRLKPTLLPFSSVVVGCSSASAFCATSVSEEAVATAKARGSGIFRTWKWGCDDPQAFFEGKHCRFHTIRSARSDVLQFYIHLGGFVTVLSSARFALPVMKMPRALPARVCSAPVPSVHFRAKFAPLSLAACAS